VGEQWKGLSGPEDLPGVDDLLGSLLWYDALCINQLDYEERSQQVAIMGKIYRQATTVLVHIPNTEHNCFEVKALVNDIKGFIEKSGALRT
jgi:hypothetical protein